MKLVGEQENIENNLLYSQYLKNDSIEPRKYQLSIAARCINRNSLVIIPTGLGKTIIAAMICAKTFELYPDDHKIIMMAPTKPLISQHATNFNNFIDITGSNPPQHALDFTECILTGSVSPEKRTEIFRENKLLFYTPQTLRNDLLQGRYDLQRVCLLIYDEAHRASGNYAYCDISHNYREINTDGISLGLTASPGSNKEKIQELCDNLNIPMEHIEIRTRKDSDVRPYLHKMDIQSIGVTMNKLMHDILRDLESLYKEKVGQLIRLGIIDEKGWNTDQISRKQLVGLNAIILQKISNKKRQPYGDSSNYYKALSINAEAMRLGHMISVVEGQGLDVLMEYFQKMQKESQKSNASKALKALVHHPLILRIRKILLSTISIDPDLLIHPKFFKLRDLLEIQLQGTPDSKILVFAKLRDTVKQITKNLKVSPKIRPVRFVGQASKGKNDKGLSQKRQIEIIEQFKRGKYNVLVSTNVAEEGLDIAECDLVIFYDTVASEIRLIQRRGRTARKRDGEVIILYCKGTSDEIYLHISMQRLKKMREALEKNESDMKNTKLTSFLTKTKTEDMKRGKKDLKGSEKRDDKKLKASIVLNKEIPSYYGIRQSFQNAKISYRIIQTDKFPQIKFEIFKPTLFVKDKLAVFFIKREILDLLISIHNSNKPERALVLQDLDFLRKNFKALLFFMFNDNGSQIFGEHKTESTQKICKQWQVITKSEIIQISNSHELTNLITKIVEDII